MCGSKVKFDYHHHSIVHNSVVFLVTTHRETLISKNYAEAFRECPSVTTDVI